MKTFGELYHDAILSLPGERLKRLNLPENVSETFVEQDLYGWKLYYRFKGAPQPGFMECRCEEEAELIKIFLDMGRRIIVLPIDVKHTKKIAPKFTRHKKRLDEIIRKYSVGLEDPEKIRLLRKEVYDEVFDSMEKI